MAYDTVFFDLDGTITDPKVGITQAVQCGLRKFGKEAESADDLVCYIGPPLRESFMKYGGLTEEQAEEALKEYRAYYGVKGIFEATVYEGIEDLFKSVRKSGKRIVLATSKPQVFANRILEHYGLSGYFDFVAGAELTTARNEKWEVIDYAIKTLNLNPEKVIMVGDRLHDIEGAHRNGLKCVAVLYGYGSEEEFREYNADYVAKDVFDLNTILNQL